MHSVIASVFKTLEKTNLTGKKSLSHVPDGLKPFLLSYLLEKQNQSILYLTDSNQKAEETAEYLKDLKIEAEAIPFYDILPYESEKVTPILLFKRIKAFYSILSKEKKVYTVPLKSFLFPQVSASYFNQKGSFLIRQGKTMKRNEFIQFLTFSGYTRMPHVERIGDFSVRGEVIDFYCFYYDHPVRIDFFDEEVEKIKFFNLSSQTALKGSEKDEIKVYAHLDFQVPEEKIETLLSSLASTFTPASIREFRLYLKENPNDIHLIPFFYKKTLLEFFESSENPVFTVSEDFSILDSSYKNLMRELKEMYFGSFNISKMKADPKDYFKEWDSFKPEIDLQFKIMTEGESLSLLEYFTPTPYYQGKLELFKSHLKEWRQHEIIIGCSYEGQMERVKDIFPELKAVLSGSLEQGFINHPEKKVFVLEQEIFGKKYLTNRKKNILLASSPIDSFSDMERGDFVIHINHGVGRYEGIEKVAVLGKNKDYIKIAYAEESNLYVPIEQVFLIHKYIGSSENPPRLDRIGGKAWESRKEKVRRRMEEMAEELAMLYGKRLELKGYKYEADSKWQHEFEAGFPYEETEDQLKAIEDIKKDMESDKPMDRLVCGDVGYGKTEIAMRACFKAVSNGKQVAVLVPTTLLAEQHYQSFLERFDNFSVNIKMLSRLVPQGETVKTLKGLKEGMIDIVIGTHKILGDQVVFKDLGLLVIDEEQRFGVKHKEKIKKFKASIDVLTLSATPIPRTLYMGLSELRDMSLITTPPVSRMPIKTFVMPFNDNLLIQSVRRELERKGQIFMIHNRVKTIHQFAGFIQGLVPEAKIVVGHGQLEPHEIEDIFLNFIHGENDILIATTIIENGIDIPNANTIIIDRPELLGLSELYQLRGRVGRGDKQGYAYLFYDPVNGLSPDVQRRLEVIEENTELGSGFKIAMKDLEIRGAGNLLGREQNGFIADVGIELFAKLMRKAVQEVKGQIQEEEIEPLIDLCFNGYIPDSYIFEEKERFSIYKIIMRANELEEVDNLTKQIEDRYGRIPEIVSQLLFVSKIKVVCKQIRLRELKERTKDYQLSFIKNDHIKMEKIAGLLQKKTARIDGENLLIQKEFFQNENSLESILKFLSELKK